jgi:heme A synthase
MHDVDVSQTSRALHGWSVLVVAWTALLAFAGANVTTTASGDAIPTWPEPLFPRDFGTPALIEWSHRGVAAWLLVFTLVLAVWVQRRDERRAVRRTAWVAFGLVVAQAALGGARVLMVSKGGSEDPAWWKTAHAVLFEVYFCTVVALMTVLSPSWRRAQLRDLDTASMSVLRAALAGVVLLFVQVLLGALGRHGLMPREVHAFFALLPLVAVAKLVLAGAFDVDSRAVEITRPAKLLGVLAAVQIALGLITYFVAATGPAPEQRDAGQVVTMGLHLVVGAALLGTTLAILMRTVRVFGLPTDERVAAAERAAAGGVS